MDPPEKTETEIGASSEEQTVKSEEQPRECKKPLGDRMKEYEAPFGTIKIDPKLPYIVRCDGHHFSKFMKAFDKPSDFRMHRAMLLTTHDMVFRFSGCVCGFTCSDEITLVFPATQTEAEPTIRPEHNGRLVKTLSLFSGFASSAFYRNLVKVLNEDPAKNASVLIKVEKTIPHFDARVFNVPHNYEVINNIKWRHLYDYRRNSISGIAQKHFKPKDLFGLHSDQLLAKLQTEKSVDWHDMPGWYKWGAFVKKQKFTMPVWVGKKQGHQEPGTILVTKVRTITRIFEMTRKQNPEDDEFIFCPFIEFADPAKGFKLNERDQKDERATLNFESSVEGEAKNRF